ncbi:MAG TPA: hypothetical protein VFG83_13255, partial [Kofleriaceae bacterium]|nr:hypothetical protein [Kofleriaceae bacterium]
MDGSRSPVAMDSSRAWVDDGTELRHPDPGYHCFAFNMDLAAAILLDLKSALCAAVVLCACAGARNPAPRTGDPLPVSAHIPADVLVAMGHRSDRAAILATGPDNQSTVVSLTRTPPPAPIDLAWAGHGRGEVHGAAAGEVVDRPGLIARRVATRILAKPVGWQQAAAVRVPAGFAEAHIAAAWLAQLTAAPRRPEVAIVAMVYPDGSLGPVIDGPDLVARAQKSGKAIIGVAAAAAPGRDHVVALSDVVDAYHLLTGETLPRAVPVPVAAMALPADASRGATAAYDRARASLAPVWADLLAAQGPALAGLDAITREAEKLAARGERARTRGDLAAAIPAMIRAGALARAALTAHHLYRRALAGEIITAPAPAPAPATADDLAPSVAGVVVFALRIRAAILAELARGATPAANTALAAFAGQKAPARHGHAAATQMSRAVVPALLARGHADIAAARATALAAVAATGRSPAIDARAASAVAAAYTAGAAA